MSYIDDLNKEIVDGSDIFHEFLLKYSPDKILGFVEGDDDFHFYQTTLETIIPNEWEVILFSAGNKDKVIKKYQAMDWSRFPKEQISFYIDRDHSEYVGENIPYDCNVYITDEYSIESSFISENTYKRVLRELLGLKNLSESELSHLVSIFNQELGKFQKYITPITAIILCWRLAGKKMNLNDIKLDRIFKFDKGLILIKENFSKKVNLIEFMHKSCNVPLEENFSIETIEDNINQNGNYKSLIRGKYLLWFFIKHSLSVRNSLRDLCPSQGGLKKLPKIHITLSDTNAVIHVAPLVRPPNSLKTFIQSNHLKYIEQHKELKV